MMKRQIILISAIAVFLILPMADVHAHILWLSISEKSDKEISMTVGWGHAFPKTDTPLSKDEHDRLDQIKAVDPEGKAVAVTQKNPDLFGFVPDKAGSYVITAGIKPGFVCKTVDGYKFGTRKDVEKAVTCTHYDLRTKAVIPSGSGDKGYLHTAGDPLEIIPMKSVAGLKESDILPVKILFNGKPLAGATIEATYVGYSGDPGKFPVSVVSDDNGMANISILKTGSWLITVKHKIPYADSSVCDNELFGYSLTFGN